ncbi:hypothetical protein FACS1894187_24850 [Synergistales bacterium]|nr:hypothetical protein FACS1894187_24850 [Synergistales bacterium]
MKYKHAMRGPKTLGEWIEAYEERDSDTEYVLSPGERIVYDDMHGFFTYLFDPREKLVLIPKMCGDGKHWRKQILKLVLATRHLGVKGAYCCTKRNPVAYMRVLGGTLRKMEHTYDFVTGRQHTIWYILITPEDTKTTIEEEVSGDDDDTDSDSDTDIPVGG